MRVIRFLLFILVSSSLGAQHKQDYYWPEGNRTLDTSDEIRGMAFDFNELPMIPEVRESPLGFNRTIASISDLDGQLLFYTNGCQVADRTHAFMDNGDSLNFNNYYAEWLNGCGSGALSRQDILILPDPGNTKGHYIIHKPSEYQLVLDPPDYEFWNEYILFSYVDMEQNAGLGRLAEKNDTILNRRIQWSHLTAINHSNGKDWWILQPGFDSTYYRILLDETGFSRIDSQSIGPTFYVDGVSKISGNGKSRFSPDGSKYVHFDLFDGLHLYDFDRSTGLLSNGRYLDWFFFNDQNWAGSVEFSPNSRFLYLTNQYELYQLDIDQPKLEDGLLKVAERDTSILAPFETTFFDMLLAPDCKIYVRTGSSSYLMHIIHDPNAKGLACDFRQGNLVLPRTSSLGGFPTFPPFRVDQENKCDPTISMVDGVNSFWRRDLSFSPNPARTQIGVQIPEGGPGLFRVRNLMGSQVYEERIDSGVLSLVHNVAGYPSGPYFVEFLPRRNTERLLFSSKLIIVD